MSISWFNLGVEGFRDGWLGSLEKGGFRESVEVKDFFLGGGGYIRVGVADGSVGGGRTTILQVALGNPLEIRLL